MFTKLLEFLQGKKTYIVAALLAIFNFGVAVTWWAPENQTWEIINLILGALGLGFLGAKVNRLATNGK